MNLCGFGVAAAANVIQWHVLAMFLPSFVTGRLIRRFGVLLVIGAGIACMMASAVISQIGLGLPQFFLGLTLLGLGWNFMYIGGTTLLAEAHQPAERAKAQAFHDFVVFAVLSLASFAAASFGSPDGWQQINRFAMFPLALALAMVTSMGFRRWWTRR
jgi:MFS family permease